MNIYNKLFVLEYTRVPVLYCYSKNWCLNLSKKKYNYNHRDFDLYSFIKFDDINKTKCFSYKKFNNWYRLIGPAFLEIHNGRSRYHFRNRRYYQKQLNKI